MNKSRKLTEKMLTIQAKNKEPLDESILEKMYGPNDTLVFSNDGFDCSFVVNSWEFPRCANFVDSNGNILAKLEIPMSDCKNVNIIHGNLTDDQKKDAISLFNSVRHGITCYEAMIARIDMLGEKGMIHEL